MSLIASSLLEAKSKKSQIYKAINSFDSFNAQSLSGYSGARPQSDHDIRIASYRRAASSYVESLKRDADAIEQIGLSFDGEDWKAAYRLLGY